MTYEARGDELHYAGREAVSRLPGGSDPPVPDSPLPPFSLPVSSQGEQVRPVRFRLGPLLAAAMCGVYAKQALEASGAGEQEQGVGFLGPFRGEYHS